MVINSKAENDFVFKLAAERKDIEFLTWLGAESIGLDAENKPIFQWVTGQPLKYNNMDPNNQPIFVNGFSDWQGLVLNNGSNGFNPKHYWNSGTNSYQGVSSWHNGGQINGRSATICELDL